MNENLLEKNKRVYKKLNIPVWHKAGIKGNGVNIAVIGYGACLSYKKPYIRQVNKLHGGSYHDGDEIIHNVAPQATIYSINMKDKDGWNFKKCLEWVVKHKPDVVCLSFKIHHLTNEEKDLIEQAYNNGTIMIASTGNDNSYVAYPARDKHWIGVGAYSGLSKSKASYSNYGEGLDCLGYTNFGVEAQPDYYMQISHTSGATQAIAGMAGLLKEHVKITPSGFKKFIRDYCIDLLEDGWDEKTGYGLFMLPKDPYSIKDSEYSSNNNQCDESEKEGEDKMSEITYMDSSAKIIDGRFYIPARFLVEHFGGNAVWDKDKPDKGIFELNGKRLIFTKDSTKVIVENI